jgi:Rrf2 family protein
MLSMKAKYALRALALLAQPGSGLRQAHAIAREADIPGKFLESILVDLRNAGLVDSRRGVLGGHRLARDASEISLGEVVRVVDGPIAPLRCASVTAYRPCSDCPNPDRCAVRRLMGEVRQAMSSVIDHRTLAQFARDTADQAAAPLPTPAALTEAP